MERELWRRMHFHFGMRKMNAFLSNSLGWHGTICATSNYAKQCMQKDFGCNIILAMFERHGLVCKWVQKTRPNNTISKIYFWKSFSQSADWKLKSTHTFDCSWKKQQQHVPLIIHMGPVGSIFFFIPNSEGTKPSICFSTASPSDFINSICLAVHIFVLDCMGILLCCCIVLSHYNWWKKFYS